MTEQEIQASNVVFDSRGGSNNPYLVLGFFQFAIIATLFTVFFPWSLLFYLFVYGMEETKFLVVALLHDFVKTAWVVLLTVLSIVFVFVMVMLAIS